MFPEEIERIARNAKPIIERLRTELAVGTLSEPITGSTHPQVFSATEKKELTDYRVAFALGIAPAEILDHVYDDGEAAAQTAVACRIRSEITGDPILALPEKDPADEPDALEPTADDDAKGEPEPQVDKDLPEGFPGRKALAEAEPPITTWGQVRAKSEAGTLTDIKGIGPSTADEIQAALLPETTGALLSD